MLRHLRYNYMVQLLKRLSLWIFVGLLAYMPLHIFLSTWIGTSFGALEFAKVAKDVILVIGFLFVLMVSIRQKWFGQILKDRMVWLIVVYAAWTVLLAMLKPTDGDAEVLGVVYNLRFLMFFLYGMMLARLFDVRRVKAAALKAVLGVATIVLFFGVVQYTILPNETLTHFGYSRANGVLPAFFIDDKPDLERVMSTLRDPNSLGSYSIIIGMLGMAFLLRNKITRQTAIGLLALTFLCLVFTFSRSSWLGFALAIVVLLVMRYGKKINQYSKQISLSLVGVMIIGVILLVPLRDTYFVQNVVFHADQSTVLENPNQLRTRFWQESVTKITDEPLGHGPGTAGLASIRNDIQGTTLNENYYLQIGHEVGIIGLGLFLIILGLVGWRLLKASTVSSLALGLFGAFTGLALTNFLVHIWSNEAVAYTWWGLTAIGLSGSLLSGTGIMEKHQKLNRESK